MASQHDWPWPDNYFEPCIPTSLIAIYIFHFISIYLLSIFWNQQDLPAFLTPMHFLCNISDSLYPFQVRVGFLHSSSDGCKNTKCLAQHKGAAHKVQFPHFITVTISYSYLSHGHIFIHKFLFMLCCRKYSQSEYRKAIFTSITPNLPIMCSTYVALLVSATIAWCKIVKQCSLLVYCKHYNGAKNVS